MCGCFIWDYKKIKIMINIKHTLYPFQEKDMNNLIQAFDTNRKICFTAHTGYGKTYSFCTVAKWFIVNKKQKAIIICHSEELIKQSMATCISMGLTVETIYSSTSRLHHKADVYIAMEKTLYNRISKNKHFLLDVGLVIIDECHGQNFLKHINFFVNQKILGFTATPILNERITYWKCERCDSISYELKNCCNREPWEWSKPKTMSLFYDNVVVGASINELIEYGQVVKDICFVSEFTDLRDLKTDAKGEFTAESQNDAFGKNEALFNVLLNYENIAKGKKTIIFNPSAKVNKLIYEQFKEKGYNIKLYDSRNDTDLNRKETVKWFNETEGAILTNINCFTTGFDSTDIECVILNRSTTSLSLFLQCVGRGARSSNNIYKDSFIVIDGGGNINRHNKWSDPTRDWYKIFHEGIGVDKPKKEVLDSVRYCDDCGNLYSRNLKSCDVCGESAPVFVKEESEISEDVLQPIDDVPLPNGENITKYVKRKDGDVYMALKIMTKQIVDLFMYHGVPKEQYLAWQANGKLDKRLGEIIRGCYFYFTNEFTDWKRTLKQVQKKVKESLGKYYNI